MRTLNRKYQSIFYIATLFFFLLAVQIGIFGNFFNELQNDTKTINDFSQVRGTIQRYVKLELSGVKVDGLNLEKSIDQLILSHDNEEDMVPLNEVSLYYNLNELRSSWNDLKILVREYHKDPSPQNQLAVIDKSEECWGLSNAYILRNQYALNQLTRYYKYILFAIILNLLAIALILYLYKRLIYNRLAESAINDSLTGTFNRGYFTEYLAYEFERSKRKKTTFSLIMLDIDHFKKVNDTYGHRRGDYALKTLVQIVKKSTRKIDVLARVGGEEFILLLPDTSLKDAAILASRVRRNCESFLFEEIGTMTISLGITELTDGDNIDSILKRVDSALYKAKENGRNRCEIIEGEINE